MDFFQQHGNYTRTLLYSTVTVSKQQAECYSYSAYLHCSRTQYNLGPVHIHSCFPSIHPALISLCPFPLSIISSTLPHSPPIFYFRYIFPSPSFFTLGLQPVLLVPRRGLSVCLSVRPKGGKIPLALGTSIDDRLWASPQRRIESTNNLKLIIYVS